MCPGQLLLRVLLAVWLLTPETRAWWGWSEKKELEFDVSNVSPLVESKDLFGDTYRRQMQWGTYRPGVYFGVKGRHKGSLLYGTAWASADGKVLRHDCKSGELRKFGWLEHDGERYGSQELEDDRLNLRLLTRFVKDFQEPDRAWLARVEAKPLKPVANVSQERPVSLFVYLGVESTLGDLKMLSGPGNEPTIDWVMSEGGGWTYSVRVSGRDPVRGAFTASIVVRVDGSSPKPTTAPRYVAVPIQPESTEDTTQASTGVWNAQEHIHKNLRRSKSSKSGKPGSVSALPNKEVGDQPNWWALQFLARASLMPRIDTVIEFDVEEGEHETSPSGGTDKQTSLDEFAARASDEFKQKLDKVFEVKAPFNSDVHRAAASKAVAGLLGGLGEFRGRLLAKRRNARGKEDGLMRLPEAVLFSGVPSRSFFPRGFLWDEGFHGLLLVRWQPQVFLDVLAHWLELQQSTGWIPREVPLGAEQEVRVPPQFLPQDPIVANPPSLLLPLTWLVLTTMSSKSKAEVLAARAHIASGDELRHLVIRFGAAALPRLAAWFAFLDRSQKSAHKAGCYKWAGRTGAHCLASGLDDYPRGLLVNEDECHLDLHAWMALFASILAALCQHLSGSGLLPGDKAAALCTKPNWAGRVETLNTSLHEVFAPTDSRKPLADFIGKQPIDRKKNVQVIPPWRSDGRCGPQVGGGECDPYGGGPCCSPSGWCGGSPDFCDCPGCVRYAPLEDRKFTGIPSHSPHLGYVSLFPVLLGLVPWDHPRALPLLDALQPQVGKKSVNTLWSPHGVMSLSSRDPLFRQGEDYWRGKVWANLNFLTISALRPSVKTSGSAVLEKIEAARASLSNGFVSTVVKALQQQHFFFENFDPASGEGRGVGPFTGWTTLLVLIMADEPVKIDLQHLLHSQAAAGDDDSGGGFGEL